MMMTAEVKVVDSMMGLQDGPQILLKLADLRSVWP